MKYSIFGVTKNLLCVAVFIFTSQVIFGHPINYELEKAPAGDVFWFYFTLGVKHIVPYGLDHILFVAGLCLLNNKMKTIIWQATAFTVAHSITLALSMKNIIVAPSAIVEPIIALSILFIAVENLFSSELQPWRVVLVFVFGLVHGLGFASVLSEVGLPRNNFLASIIAFNIGVEAGQVMIIATMFGLIILPFYKKPWFKKRIVYPLSILIALVALYWTVQRVFYM